MTNKEFSKKDSTFNQACKLLGIKCNIRQASKFRNKKGSAYSFWQLNRSQWAALLKNKMDI